MAQFFIRRPVFAWAIALFIILLGVLSIPKLPIDRFPSVAPPQISITATVDSNMRCDSFKTFLIIS